MGVYSLVHILGEETEESYGVIDAAFDFLDSPSDHEAHQVFVCFWFLVSSLQAFSCLMLNERSCLVLTKPSVTLLRDSGQFSSSRKLLINPGRFSPSLCLILITETGSEPHHTKLVLVFCGCSCSLHLLFSQCEI